MNYPRASIQRNLTRPGTPCAVIDSQKIECLRCGEISVVAQEELEA